MNVELIKKRTDPVRIMGWCDLGEKIYPHKVVQYCSRTPILKFHILMLLFKLALGLYKF